MFVPAPAGTVPYKVTARNSYRACVRVCRAGPDEPARVAAEANTEPRAELIGDTRMLREHESFGVAPLFSAAVQLRGGEEESVGAPDGESIRPVPCPDDWRPVTTRLQSVVRSSLLLLLMLLLLLLASQIDAQPHARSD